MNNITYTLFFLNTLTGKAYERTQGGYEAKYVDMYYLGVPRFHLHFEARIHLLLVVLEHVDAGSIFGEDKCLDTGSIFALIVFHIIISEHF